MRWLSPCLTILVFSAPLSVCFSSYSSSSFSVSHTSSPSQFCPHFLHLLLSFLSSSVFLCLCKALFRFPPRTISHTSTRHVYLIFVRGSHSHNVHHIPRPNTCHKEAKSNKVRQWPQWPPGKRECQEAEGFTEVTEPAPSGRDVCIFSGIIFCGPHVCSGVVLGGPQFCGELVLRSPRVCSVIVFSGSQVISGIVFSRF